MNSSKQASKQQKAKYTSLKVADSQLFKELMNKQLGGSHSLKSHGLQLMLTESRLYDHSSNLIYIVSVPKRVDVFNIFCCG